MNCEFMKSWLRGEYDPIRCMEFSENGKELNRLIENWRDDAAGLLVLDSAARN